MVRKILHLDLDAFFCAVEELRDPSLRGKAFAVGGRPEARGVVASCSYAARQFGVRSAMPMGRALRQCPDLIIVPGRHERYHEMSQQVMERIYALTAQVEQVSIDEAFIDLSDLPDTPRDLACRLQAAIRDDLSLPCSIGAATNKLLAKMANDVGKASRRGTEPPRAVTVVPPGEEANFLAPLPVGALWGVGPKTAARLNDLGLHTVGDLARAKEASLVRLFGKNGADLYRRAQGIDDSPIITSRAARSISQEVTFDRDVARRESLITTLRRLSEGVGRRLRSEPVIGATVKIKLRWSDFTTFTRQVTLPQPTDQDNVIYDAALQLFEQAWDGERPIRLLGVGVSGLMPPQRQLTLWDTPIEKEHRLLEALDKLRERYGGDIIHRGSH